jgi:hypothetical protein
MLTRFLFPHRFKRLGWVLATVALVLGMFEMYEIIQLPRMLAWLPAPISDSNLPAVEAGKLVRNNHDLYAVLFICGSLLAACSRERREDEYIGQIRLESLLWALYAYYALLLVAFVVVSGLAFFTVMTYALFAPLLLFLVRFHVVLYSSAKAATHEE